MAADRTTKTLPLVLSELFFIGGWIISLIKAASSEPGPTNWVNVEAQSIAISALYLWATSAVALGSFIGASQTEDAIPRLLGSFEKQLAQISDSVDESDMFWCRRSVDRAIHGGAYSWRPDKWKREQLRFDVGGLALVTYSLVATFVVGSGFLAAALLSFLVAPRGWSCRHIPETLV